MAGSGAFDILVAQIDLSQFRGSDEAVWCEMIVRALADAAEGSDALPGGDLRARLGPAADRIAALARERDVPLLRGTEHALRALGAVARWRPRQPARPRRPGRPRRPAAGGCRCPSTSRRSCSSATASRSRRAGARRRRTRRPARRTSSAFRSSSRWTARRTRRPRAASCSASRPRGRRRRLRSGSAGACSSPAAACAGPEAFCGMTRDPDYGPVVAVGLGRRRGRGALARGRLPRADRPRARPGAGRRGAGTRAVACEAALETLARTVVALGPPRGRASRDRRVRRQPADPERGRRRRRRRARRRRRSRMSETSSSTNAAGPPPGSRSTGRTS